MRRQGRNKATIIVHGRLTKFIHVVFGRCLDARIGGIGRRSSRVEVSTDWKAHDNWRILLRRRARRIMIGVPFRVPQLHRAKFHVSCILGATYMILSRMAAMASLLNSITPGHFGQHHLASNDNTNFSIEFLERDISPGSLILSRCFSNHVGPERRRDHNRTHE
jgi:hypothetical protein